MTHLIIGEAATRSGLSAKTIRYYEDIGLIGRAVRTGGGYRAYSDADVQTLIFLKRARNLGFSVEDCRNLLSLYHDKSRASADVKALALKRIGEIEAKIVELESMKETLAHLARHCRGDSRPDCPIISDLEHAEPATVRRRKH
jgi:MerR family transcriptional regulator, copper efflux regulator